MTVILLPFSLAALRAHNQTWTHRAGQHFCSTVQFELRHCDGKTTARDASRNGTFLNLDEVAGADADAFKTFKQEQKWLSQQHPDPRLKSDDDGQGINHGDQIYFRLSFDRSKFTRFVWLLLPFALTGAVKLSRPFL